VLNYIVIYLSPGDYHRFHAPAIHTARFRRHIVGYLSPVKPSYVENHKDVFKNNERVNIFGDWFGEKKNFFFLSYVGALNVGSIKLDFDKQVATNTTMPKDPYMFDRAYVKSQQGPLGNYIAEKMIADDSEALKF
jgi:phosphatidylserine decarboxylase